MEWNIRVEQVLNGKPSVGELLALRARLSDRMCPCWGRHPTMDNIEADHAK